MDEETTVRCDLVHSSIQELKQFVDACEFCGVADFWFDGDNFFDSPHLEATVNKRKYNEFLDQQ
jgi:hypothetical protein